MDLALQPFQLTQGMVPLVIVSEAAAQLLASVAGTIRPPFLLEMPSFNAALGQAGPICASVEPGTRLVIANAFSYSLILPCHGIPQQQHDWETRASQHRELICSLLADYIVLQGQPEFLQGNINGTGIAIVNDACLLMASLAQSVREQKTMSKDILARTLEPILPSTLQLLRLFTGNSGVLKQVLAMFFNFFEAMAARLGSAFIQQTVDTFHSVFTPDQLTTLAGPEGGGSSGVEVFLRILGFFVRERSKVFKNFLPEIVSLCLDRIYPIVAEQPAVTIRLALFDVLKHILLENWKFFYPSGVMPSQASEGQADELQNEQYFMAILQAFALSFTQCDINQFKQNLATLKELNEHRKLFQKGHFRAHMLFPLLETLFQALSSGSFDILVEEVVSVIYDLAAVDFAAFFSTFIPQLLTNASGLTDPQRHELAAHFHFQGEPVRAFECIFCVRTTCYC